MRSDAEIDRNVEKQDSIACASVSSKLNSRPIDKFHSITLLCRSGMTVFRGQQTWTENLNIVILEFWTRSSENDHGLFLLDHYYNHESWQKIHTNQNDYL
jgi:hypothetical protein